MNIKIDSVQSVKEIFQEHNGTNIVSSTSRITTVSSTAKITVYSLGNISRSNNNNNKDFY